MMMIPTVDDPWTPGLPPGGGDGAAAWRERERRQRSIRLLMMFLLMLLLMDSEEQASPHPKDPSLRKQQQQHRKTKPQAELGLSQEVFAARRGQDELLWKLSTAHERYGDLVKLNQNQNVEAYIRKWASQQSQLQERSEKENKMEKTKNDQDSDNGKKVFHYPWNSTGFYRGEWIRQEESVQDESDDAPKSLKWNHISPSDMETPLRTLLKERQESVAAVMLLPHQTKFQLPPNYTHSPMEQIATEALESASSQSSQRFTGSLFRMPTPELNVVVEDAAETEEQETQLTLTKTFGRAAFQFYSRPVPGMEMLSLVDGFVKLYDSQTVGYSTRRDVLLRVKGVLLHSIGRLSLVSNTVPGRSAFVMAASPFKGKKTEPHKNAAENATASQERRRLLLDLVDQVEGNNDKTITEVRDQTLLAYPFDVIRDKGYGWSIISSSKVEEQVNLAFQLDRSGWLFDMIEQFISPKLQGGASEKVPHRRLTTRAKQPAPDTESVRNETSELENTNATVLGDLSAAGMPKDIGEGDEQQNENQTSIERRMVEAKKPAKAEKKMDFVSKFVFPYPYVTDDENDSVRKSKTPASRRMPTREQVLEGNAGRCEFELSLDVKEIEWTVGEWKTMLKNHVREINSLDPRNKTELDTDEEESYSKTKHVEIPDSSVRNLASKPLEDQALVMSLTGSIHSPNCEFSALLNATAIRTNWEHTTGKAINYSFYMMLTCLTQIVVLLRQLLHTQHQSNATRVSLLCIGWQAILDALLCLSHIYLSLAMQPLFTAFASVAFFKLLIFCVIEMKYMTIIIQARNNANGGQSTAELLRRQVAILHLRFYIALIVSFLAFLYAGQPYRTLYMLGLYSFWVPQIVYNIITETKRPLHVYYIYGISATRMVAPLYVFAMPNNFLKEVFPDTPTNYFMVEMIFLWIGIQTAVLIGQSKYGARFMIPARFLPPKFDYHRPIPASLIPPEALEPQPEPKLKPAQAPATNSDASNQTGVKNRMKGSKVGRQEPSTITTINEPPDKSPTLDCVICCSEVEIRNRKGYMLPPCNHIFHKECLVSWMDVKMECPICRTELPAL